MKNDLLVDRLPRLAQTDVPEVRNYEVFPEGYPPFLVRRLPVESDRLWKATGKRTEASASWG